VEKFMAEIFQTHYALEGDAETRARRFTRWVGGSIIVHALLLAALFYVPAVRDTFSLANQLAGFRVVSEDYEKTQVYERAVLVNLSAQKLYYPAGYFQVASQTAVPSPDDPKFVATVNPTPEPTPKPVKPKPTPSPSPDAVPSPTSADETAQDAKAKDAKDAGASASPSPSEPKTVEEAKEIMKQSGVGEFPQVNSKPFENLYAEGKKMKDAGEIDLSAPLEMTVEADRREDGVLTNVRVTSGAKIDPKVDKLAKDFISALSDSKVLAALAGTRHLMMKVGLDQKQLSVTVVTEVASEEHARLMSIGYRAALSIGKRSKAGRDEEKIFDSVNIDHKSKQIILTFKMPRADAGALLSKLTEKSKATPPGE
jgi:hypothetical protein